MCKYFFSKTENGTEYRIYLQSFCDFPILIRSALDAADGVHGELVEEINNTVFGLENSVLKIADVSGVSYADVRQAMAETARTAVGRLMESAGWTARIG